MGGLAGKSSPPPAPRLDIETNVRKGLPNDEAAAAALKNKGKKTDEGKATLLGTATKRKDGL
jgi:hypothetical protein